MASSQASVEVPVAVAVGEDDLADASTDHYPLRANYSSRAWELLHGTLRYIEQNGVDQFSLAAAAEYLDTSSRMLIYHLGSRDEILGKALTLIRYRTLAELSEPPTENLRDCCRRIVEYYLANQWEMQLFFFVSTKAFEDASAYQEFSRTSSKTWVTFLSEAGIRSGLTETQAADLSAIILAAIRGLLLDLFLTGERDRVDAAFLRLYELIS